MEQDFKTRQKGELGRICYFEIERDVGLKILALEHIP